jgi:hypothetical protein
MRMGYRILETTKAARSAELQWVMQQFLGEHEPSVRKGVIKGKKAPIDYMYF